MEKTAIKPGQMVKHKLGIECVVAEIVHEKQTPDGSMKVALDQPIFVLQYKDNNGLVTQVLAIEELFEVC